MKWNNFLKDSNDQNAYKKKKKKNIPLSIKEIGLVISHYQKSNFKAKMVNSYKCSTKI